jgi:hypothetical protein
MLEAGVCMDGKILRSAARTLRRFIEILKLPHAAKVEWFKDLKGLPSIDPGIPRAVDEAMGWLKRAQDNSRTRDGGVARHYSLVSGWGASYPETSGYIIPTMIKYAKLQKDEEARQRAKKILDWLVSIQLPEGGFQGGTIDSKPAVPVVFNTGQILLGLAAGVCEFGNKYLEPMCCAAEWLVKTQDQDGCWHKFPSPFSAPGEKTYDTHVAWGLLEAARIEPNKGYADSALSQVQWALNFQKENGWLDKCCLNDPSEPLTHTLGYMLRGILETYRFSNEKRFLRAAIKTADGLLSALKPDGFLPGRFRQDWGPAVSWACLTGTAQIAICWLILYQVTHQKRYRDAAYAANRYVRRSMCMDGAAETRGAIKGSFPVNGRYGAWEYLNWGCKFFIDANLLESEIRSRENTNGSKLDQIIRK